MNSNSSTGSAARAPQPGATEQHNSARLAIDTIRTLAMDAVEKAKSGALGQGCGNSVGMAMAQRWLAAQFNRPEIPLIDYNIYVFCSDGDLMEGVASEAASIAGHLKLSNLCWIYDNNHITIEGNTALAFSEDVGTRFHGYGWAVFHVADANHIESIEQALAMFQAEHDRPTLIIVDSHIGYGAPHKQDT